MVALGVVNSRMKDFYDVGFLARRHRFDGARLADAIRQTFERRTTGVPTEPPTALTSAFYADPIKARQWAAFLRKARLDEASPLAEVAEHIRAFLMPPSKAVASGEGFEARWAPGGPWRG